MVEHLESHTALTVVVDETPCVITKKKHTYRNTYKERPNLSQKEPIRSMNNDKLLTNISFYDCLFTKPKNSPNSKFFVSKQSERYQNRVAPLCRYILIFVLHCFCIVIIILFRFVFNVSNRVVITENLKHQNEIQFGRIEAKMSARGHKRKRNNVQKRIRRKCISCHSMKRIPHITSAIAF